MENTVKQHRCWHNLNERTRRDDSCSGELWDRLWQNIIFWLGTRCKTPIRFPNAIQGNVNCSLCGYGGHSNRAGTTLETSDRMLLQIDNKLKGDRKLTNLSDIRTFTALSSTNLFKSKTKKAMQNVCLQPSINLFTFLMPWKPVICIFAFGTRFFQSLGAGRKQKRYEYRRNFLHQWTSKTSIANLKFLHTIQSGLVIKKTCTYRLNICLQTFTDFFKRDGMPVLQIRSSVSDPQRITSSHSCSWRFIA